MKPAPRLRPAEAVAVPAALALVLAAGCAPPEPVAELSVEPAEVVLAYPETARLEAAWVPAAPLEAPIVFVHLLSSEGELLRTFDQPFPGEWRAGERVVQPVRLWQSALGPPLPAGAYELTMGVVDASDRRWPLVVSGDEVYTSEYAVARVEVPPPPVGGPVLRLDQGWEPAGADADRQTLGVRWLRGDGAIEIAELTAPLDLVLTLRLPAPAEMSMALVPEEGAAQPSVTITPGCDAEPVRIAEPGIHEVELALRPALGERTCTIGIDPDFVYLDPQSLRRISIELRGVVWSPGAAEAAPGGGEDAAAPSDTDPAPPAGAAAAVP